MSITWYEMPERGSAKPFDGEDYLLAVPHTLGGVWQGLDPDHPFSFHIAAWDQIEGQWVTTEADDEDGGSYKVHPDAPAYWTEINLPAVYPPTSARWA